MGQFKLKIESDGESNLKTPIISNLCEITMVPKFQIDYNNKEINYLNTTTYPKYIISLLDINNNEKMKFNVNLLELSFLGKDLYTVSIYHYPMLILEFMDGNYTTTELFQANDLLINENSSKKTNTDSNINIEENLNISNLLESVPDIDSINSINDLELGQFRIKIESEGSSDLKTPILSQLCETTMVRIKKLYLIFNRYRYLSSILITTIKN
jgi:hypothetical protein